MEIIDKTAHNYSHTTFKPGDKAQTISHSHLQDIRSRVTTHEGEFLSGQKGRDYMDKYSKKYLKKDLKGSYNDTNIRDNKE